MARFQLVSCEIALAGDTSVTVVRGPERPLTYPEMLVIQMEHGEDAVFDANEVGFEERDQADEWARLKALYKSEILALVFPGARPRLPLSDQRIRPRIAPKVPRRRLAPARDDGFMHEGADVLAEGVDSLAEDERV